jgi:tRNA(Ile2) C34 agmatinyltransferase TiaS
MFEDGVFKLPCPKCGHKTEKTGEWLKANNHFICAGCGATINPDALVKILNQLDQAILSVGRKWRRGNRR